VFIRPEFLGRAEVVLYRIASRSNRSSVQSICVNPVYIKQVEQLHPFGIRSRTADDDPVLTYYKRCLDAMAIGPRGKTAPSKVRPLDRDMAAGQSPG
jgi:hypothetical protein